MVVATGIQMLWLCMSCDKDDENKGKQQTLQALALTSSYRYAQHTIMENDFNFVLGQTHEHTLYFMQMIPYCIRCCVFVRQNDSTHPLRHTQWLFANKWIFHDGTKNVNETNNSHAYVLEWSNVLISPCDRQIDFDTYSVLCHAVHWKCKGWWYLKLLLLFLVLLWLFCFLDSFSHLLIRRSKWIQFVVSLCRKLSE